MTITIRDLFVSSLKNLYRNKAVYLLTTIILQVFLGTVGHYGLSAWFRFGLRLAGESNLTQDNVLRILGQTGPFLILASYLVLVAAFMLLEFLALVYVVASSYRSFSLKDMLRAIWHKLAWLSGPQLLLFLFYLVLMIPVGNLGLTSSLLQHFRVPDFILSEANKSDSSLGIYYTVLIVVAYLNIRLLYFLPLAVVNQATPWTNLRQSWQLTKRHKLRLAATVVLLSLPVLLSILALFWGLASIFEALDSTWNNIILQTLFYTLLKSGNYLFAFLFKLIIIEVLINYLLRLDKAGEEAYFTLSETADPPLRYPVWTRLFLFLSLLGFVAYNGLQLYLVSRNQTQLMISHRGDIRAGVENSIEALEGASRAGADLVEMDVVMTADRKFAVIHDNHLDRLAGLNWNVSEKTLAQLQQLTITQGKFHSRISSLEDYIKRAKQLKQPLLIELKPYGHEPADYAERVIKELKRLNVSKSDKVMSMDLGLMETIEKKAPLLNTGHVISFQLGVLDQKKVDFYVIEDFSYNELTMASAEKQGKDLYVWTINEPDTMAGYLQSPVSGIITDEMGIFKEQQQAIRRDDTYFDRALRLFSFNSRE